jgi:hypothetical protein
MAYENYDKTRFAYDDEGKLVWLEITKFLQKFIKPDSAILDLGSGYCNFINFVRASKKYALDKYIDPGKFAAPDVKALFGNFVLGNKKIPDKSLDAVFASNFFEHLNDVEMESYISLIKKKLKGGGILMVLQPNYRLCYREYFDDFTHIKVWSDTSLKDFLRSKGFNVKLVKPRFLPFSMKSRLPKSRLLVKLYLNSLIKPFAGQMLIIAEV